MRVRSVRELALLGTLEFREDKMATLICYSCGGTGVFKEAPMNPGGINPTKPSNGGHVLQCTSCAGTGAERTFTPL